jgi:hypothetical protein
MFVHSILLRCTETVTMSGSASASRGVWYYIRRLWTLTQSTPRESKPSPSRTVHFEKKQNKKKLEAKIWGYHCGRHKQNKRDQEELNYEYFWMGCLEKEEKDTRIIREVMTCSDGTVFMSQKTSIFKGMVAPTSKKFVYFQRTRRSTTLDLLSRRQWLSDTTKCERRKVSRPSLNEIQWGCHSGLSGLCAME